MIRLQIHIAKVYKTNSVWVILRMYKTTESIGITMRNEKTITTKVKVNNSNYCIHCLTLFPVLLSEQVMWHAEVNNFHATKIKTNYPIVFSSVLFQMEVLQEKISIIRKIPAVPCVTSFVVNKSQH